MKKTKGSIMLLFAAFFWGTTFVAQTTASDQIGTFTFNVFEAEEIKENAF